MMIKPNSISPQAICFGECLWDLLPSGKIAGGAPMNVAYHLSQFGVPTAFISRIGSDKLGEELHNFLVQKGIGIEALQIDDQYPTGQVLVSLSDQNHATYEIYQPVAWDFIEFMPAYEMLVKKAPVFIFGSLAARNPKTYSTLTQLLGFANTRIFDVNLRAPFYSQSLIRELIGKSDIVKLNDEEFEIICDWFGYVGDTNSKISQLTTAFELECLIMTLGNEGALVWEKGQLYRHPGIQVEVKDTVGCGDSFLAAIIAKKLQNSGMESQLDFAAKVGAFVATKRGGTPSYQLEEIETFASLINA